MRKWRLRHLLFSWFAYWAGLVALKLGSGIAAAWSATRGPGDGNSRIQFDWSGESGIHLEIVRAGEKVWEGFTTLGALVGWAVIPPLILWIIWLRLGAAERSKERGLDALSPGSPDEMQVNRNAETVRERR
jgi:hypothetical protein